MFCGVIGNLGGDGSFDLLRVVEEVAADGVGCAWMAEEGIHIVPAISNHSLTVPQFEHQPRGLFRNLHQKHFIDDLTRYRWLRVALGDNPKRDVAGEFPSMVRYVEFLDNDVKVALDHYLISLHQFKLIYYPFHTTTIEQLAHLNFKEFTRTISNDVLFYNKTMSQLRDMQRLRQPRGYEQNTISTRSEQYQPL